MVRVPLGTHRWDTYYVVSCDKNHLLGTGEWRPRTDVEPEVSTVFQDEQSSRIVTIRHYFGYNVVLARLVP